MKDEQVIEYTEANPLTTEERVNRLIGRAMDIIVLYGWTQDEEARFADGGRCSAWNPFAACFCLDGAIVKASVDLNDYAFIRHAAFQKLDLAIGPIRDVESRFTHVAWNDQFERTVDEVVELLSRCSTGNV